MQDFHKKVAKPFLSTLIDEINTVFDFSCVGPVEALLAVDPASIPDSSNVNFKSYGEQVIKKSFDFYGKSVTYVFQGHTNFSPAILSCTTPEGLLLEYGGYISTHKRKSSWWIMVNKSATLNLNFSLSMHKNIKHITQLKS